MRRFRLSLLGILFGVVAQSAPAMLTASFSPVASPWYATHIVVVETTPIGGAFDVLESWKGDLPAGSRLVIPELIPASSAVPISKYPEWWTPEGRGSVAEQVPKQPVGSRMVLFLKRNKPTSDDETKRPEWTGSVSGNGADSIKISTVWIEDGKAYWFSQAGFTSSPLILAPGRYFDEGHRDTTISEEELKRRVVEALSLQKEMEAAAGEKDGRVRALRLKPYVLSKNFAASRFALEELGKAGPAAVGPIGEMLDDPAFGESSTELIRAMVKAGGKTAGGELNRRLERDLAFWVQTGPSLSQDWSAQLTSDSPLRYRVGQTTYLVYGLEQVDYRGALKTAMELRDLMRTLPQLTDSDGRNQIADECDALIAKLGSN